MPERSTDAGLVVRSDCVVTYAGPAVRQLVGWSDEVVIGGPMTTLPHPEDRPAPGRLLRRIMAEPGAHPPVELRVRREQDGCGVEAALPDLLDDPVRAGGWCATCG